MPSIASLLCTEAIRDEKNKTRMRAVGTRCAMQRWPYHPFCCVLHDDVGRELRDMKDDLATLLALSRRYVPECVCDGKVGWVYCPVERQHELYGLAIPCACRRGALEIEASRRLYSLSGLDSPLAEAQTFGSFDASLYGAKSSTVASLVSWCTGYARKPEGWVLLMGENGSGKTHLATAIAHEALKHLVAVYMNTMPDLLDVLRSGFHDAVGFDRRLEMLKSVRLLIIDDLGAEHSTDWAREKLYQIVDYRYRQRLAMVVTSNLDVLKDERLDIRIRSRLGEGSASASGWTRAFRLPSVDVRPRLPHKTLDT